MKVPFLQDLGLFREQRFYQSQGDLDRFLHHISQLSGDDKISLSFHQFAFNKQDLPAGSSPGKSGDYSRDLFLQPGFMAHMLVPKEFRQIFFCDC